MSDLISEFPDLLPMEEIRISEDHEYQVVEYSDGSTSTKQVYEPDKAPFITIESVSAVVDDEQTELVAGTDYEVVDKDHDGRPDAIDFSVGGDDPDDRSTFTVEYIAESVLLRYVASYEDELHRIQRDLGRVIDSRHVDLASQTGIIDGFEDQEVVEYDVQSGSEQYYLVQSDTISDGEWALDFHSPAGVTALLASESGLPRYPQRGDTISYQTRFDAGDTSIFDFLYTDVDGADDTYYRVTVDDDAGKLTLSKGDNSLSSQTSVATNQIQQTWVRVAITIGASGDISATLFDSTGSELSTVSITDIEHSGGGIRLGALNPSTESDVYFDNIRVIQRNSTDLDRIGALFGQLGRRRGRTDGEYITFLRSIVQSFAGRGTTSGIKFAVASALDIEPDRVTVTEDFDNNTYQIVFDDPFPEHQVRTVTELADLADPSGVKHELTEYNYDEDAAGSDDAITGFEIRIDTSGTVADTNWDVSNWDQMTWDPQRGTSAMVIDDDTTDDIVISITSSDSWDIDDWDVMQWDGEDGFEVMRIGDTVAIDIGKSTVDTSIADDSVAITSNIATYDTGDWDSMVWT